MILDTYDSALCALYSGLWCTVDGSVDPCHVPHGRQVRLAGTLFEAFSDVISRSGLLSFWLYFVV